MNSQFDGQIWEGIYKNFNEAGDEMSKPDDNIWDDSIWIEKQTAQQREALNKLKGDTAISELAKSSDYTLPVLLATMKQNEHCPKVLDFGGGLASSYLPLCSMLPGNFHFKFVVVENGLIVKNGNKLFKDDKRIKFVNHLPSDKSFDIIHLGSSMHYVNDWLGLVSSFAKMKPKFLVFADLPAGDIETFVTNQNFNGTKIPVRFWNINEFVSEVENCGFKLLVKSRFHSNYIQEMKSFPVQYRLNYFSQLIFTF